jgi:glycosyltransferase involved in cell wall biosynthesis
VFEVKTGVRGYRDPWDLSLQDRRAALQKGDVKIAYYYDRPDNSTFRYRVYNMIQALSKSEQSVSATFYSYDEIKWLSEDLNSVDVLVICRALYSDELNRLVLRARNRGIRIFFDVDDLVFKPEYVHFVVNTLGQDVGIPEVWDHWFSYFGRENATMSLCDEIITTNPFLAEQAEKHSGKKVWVIPNFLNREQLEFSDEIFEAKRKGGFARSSEFHVGYFSGTPSHSRDFDVVADALVELLDRDPRIGLKLVGFVEPDQRFDRFKNRIVKSPLQDFVNLQRHIAEAELNLVPLEENVFTNCKSELKFFEAAIVGTATMASPTYTYRNSIRDGKDGWLCRSYEWEAKIRGIVDNFGDYPRIAEEAREACREKYAWYNQSPAIVEALLNRL